MQRLVICYFFVNFFSRFFIGVASKLSSRHPVIEYFFSRLATHQLASASGTESLPDHYELDASNICIQRCITTAAV